MKILWISLLLLLLAGIALFIRIRTLPDFIFTQLAASRRSYFSLNFHFDKALSFKEVNQAVVNAGFLSWDKTLSLEESRKLVAILLDSSNYAGPFQKGNLYSLDGQKTVIFQDKQKKDIGYLIIKDQTALAIISKERIGIIHLQSQAYQHLVDGL